MGLVINVIPRLLYIWERYPVLNVQEVHIVFLSWNVSEPTSTHSQVDKTQRMSQEIYVNFWLEKLKGYRLHAHCIRDGRIIMQWTSKKQVEEVWSGFS
jgi:hypothetical protein